MKCSPAVVLGICVSLASIHLAGQTTARHPSAESTGTPAAKTLFDQGQAALRRSPDYGKASDFFRRAIAADPRYVEAHSQFMFASRQAALAAAATGGQTPKAAGAAATAALKKLYGDWAAAHPDNPVYEWALGSLEDNDYAAAERHYERAIAIDPAFPRVYQALALIADFRGENQKQVDFLKRAADLNPDDASYFFYYASAYKSLDPTRSVALLQEVADRYPKTERGAQGLYWAAFETGDLKTKTAIYERLRREFPPETFSWSASGMTSFFDVEMRTTPASALALATDLAARLTSDGDAKTWKELAAFAQATVDARQLLAAGHADRALALAAAAPRPRYADLTPLNLVRTDARAALGQAAGAYDDLVGILATAPTDAIAAAARMLGRTLGKTDDALSADVTTRLAATASSAPPFALPRYPDRAPVSLADYRGRVVLVNFWYPSCGPCRGEFPTLQRVLDKYKDRGFAILALNVYPAEDDMVMPYIRNNRFGFVPLATDTDWAAKTYNARGFPTNALVDADGRIAYRPGVIRGEQEERTFELEIETLLRQAGR